MPTKNNRAGQQQPYVPSGNGDESGEYRDNAYGGESLDKEQPSSIKTQPKDKPLGVKVEAKEDSKKDISTIKSSYDGKGRQNLADELSRRMGRSSNKQFVLDQIKDADDEYSGIIADYYKANEDVSLKFGKNLNSHYQVKVSSNWYTGTTSVDRSVFVGQGVFYQGEYYSKGGVFFHESGHALDDTFVKDGHRGNWSYDFISEKHGVPLREMIYKEIKENLNDEKLVALENEIATERKRLEETSWKPEEQKELDDIKAKLNESFQALQNDEHNKKLIERNNNLLNDIADLRKRWISASNEEVYRELMSKRELYSKYSEELADYQSLFYIAKYPNFEQLRQRKSELEDAKYSSHERVNGPLGRKYGDISDMIQASRYRNLKGIGMGHTINYWTNSTRGKEAFAEIMSAKATNPESLEILKRYIPKSIEIFDEIIGKIRNKGSQTV